VATIPENTRLLVLQRVRARARERWPALADVAVRTRGSFAYLDGVTHEGETLRLCRLRYLRSAAVWGFAIYLASKEAYEESVLPTGSLAGIPEDALDCACGLYFNDPTAWLPDP
jgi:hypothetical protein